ncbi:MAG: preprotein translocase subunit SecG, partial [Planctomycetota bacterium]
MPVSPLLLVPALASLLGIAKGAVFVLFVLIGIVLSVVILLQEGKGGGLGSAFGGAAADTFGVKAGTVNQFTSYLAAAFLGLALLYAGLNSSGERIAVGSPEPAGAGALPEAPAVPGTAPETPEA